MGKSDIYLPLSSADNAAVELNDCINLGYLFFFSSLHSFFK